MATWLAYNFLLSTSAFNGSGVGGQLILILPTIYNLKKKRVRGDTGATKTYTSSKKNNIQEPPVQDMKNCAV
jgi:hypothetical protein